MTDLIARIEKAQPSEARELFALAYDACFPELRFDGHTQRFIAFLDAQAYLDAAAMFVPEDWYLDIRGVNQSWWAAVNPTASGSDKIYYGYATTPALALLAAAMKARQTDERD